MLVLIVETYQTVKTVFDNISKHLKAHQKDSALHQIYISLLGVWRCGQTQSFLFSIDILLQILQICQDQCHDFEFYPSLLNFFHPVFSVLY